ARTLSPRWWRAWADVAGARSQELARGALLGGVRDPPGAATDAEEDLARPGLQTQGVRDCEEPNVEVGRTEAQSHRLGHKSFQRRELSGWPRLPGGEREEERTARISRRVEPVAEPGEGLAPPGARQQRAPCPLRPAGLGDQRLDPHALRAVPGPAEGRECG